MFGVKFRSWMETHIVRPRKKQQQQQQQSKGKGKGKVVPERPLLDSAGNSPTSPLVTKKDDHHVLHCGKIAYADDLQCSGKAGGEKQAETMAALSAQHHHHHRHHHHAYHHHGVIANTTGNNLSSPESAYSTGYSTDGTSPGASFPPEYYINIRTGTHYFHPACAAASQHHLVITSGAQRHGDQNHIRVPVSPVCKVMSTTGQNTLHRRTESCDESRYPAVIRTSFASLDEPTSPPPSAGPGTGLSMLPTPVAAAAVATASSVTASPRQRNRIRTNPWLSSSNTSTTTASVKGRNGGATTDTGGESSSCSSCKLSTKNTPIPAAAPLHKGGESSSSYGSGSDITLPRKQLNGNPASTTVVTASEENLKNSPRQQDWCRSPPSANKEQRGSVCSSSSTASSTSTSSSSCHTANNTSDFSDDDLTLNEMLGKFDESYVYEKETDILSDSDPTDCEEEYGDNSDLDTAGQDGGDEQDPQDEEELDFIDNGSYVDLNPAEMDDGTDKSTSSSGLINKGHCTYHIPNTDFIRKPTLRFRESFLRRASVRRHAKDENSPTTTATGSPVPGSRRPSIRKFNADEEGHQKLSRRSSRDGSTRHKPSRHPHDNTTGQNAYSRSSSEKRKVRCSVRRSLKDRAGKEPTCLAQVSAQNLNRILMERVLYRGGNGCALVSRSAGNTPVSLRRRILPGEKPASPSRALPQRADAEKPSCNDGGWLKQRSYSISCPRPSPGPYLSTFSSEAALIEADKEADKKYKELIQEAEHILVSMKEETVTNGIGDEKPCDNSAVEEARRNALARIEELKQQRNLRRMAQEETTQASLSSSDSDGSLTPRQTSDAAPATSNEEEKEKPTKDQQRPPLMTFRSIDLGHHDLDVSCPQSEPVKRKVYSCSATFDKLQRSLEKSQHQASLRLKPDVERKPLEKGGSLRDKLDALRRERMEVEAKVRAAQEEERQRQDDVAQSQRQLSLFRRKMLLHTIEGLKRSLEDQSAKLQETYQQEGASQKQHDSPEQ